MWPLTASVSIPFGQSRTKPLYHCLISFSVTKMDNNKSFIIDISSTQNCILVSIDCSEIYVIDLSKNIISLYKNFAFIFNFAEYAYFLYFREIKINEYFFLKPIKLAIHWYKYLTITLLQQKRYPHLKIFLVINFSALVTCLATNMEVEGSDPQRSFLMLINVNYRPRISFSNFQSASSSLQNWKPEKL